MIVHTSAIVLRTVDYGESSRIVTVFSEEHGKMALMVRGARKTKNKFSGLMEVGNLLDVVYYQKESRSVQVLSEASFLEKTVQIRTDFEKMSVALSALEMFNQLTHDGEPNPELFRMMKEFLLWLDGTEEPPKNIFPYIQIRLAGLLGFGLQLAVSRESRGPYYFDLNSGLVSLEDDSSWCYTLTERQLVYIMQALQSRSSALLKIPFGKGELKELVDYMDRYFQYHVDGFKRRKSDAIFEQILQD